MRNLGHFLPSTESIRKQEKKFTLEVHPFIAFS